MESDRHRGAFFFGMIVGIVAGAVAALFMTPKSGQQLRHQLKDQAGGVQQLVSDVTTNMRDRSEGLVGGAVDKMTQLTRREHEDEVVVAESIPVATDSAAPRTATVTDEPEDESVANPS